MLFEDEKEVFSKEAIAKLKEKARKVAEILKAAKEESENLKKEVEALKVENEKLKKRCEFFESERSELSTVVKELIDEFEQVGGNEE
jgi:predicted  nucleic acid-binding Zn-ribbon protein